MPGDTPLEPGTVVLRIGERLPADDRALEARLAAADTIVLRGGSLVDWSKTLAPREHPTAAWRGILTGVRMGADVVGLGGGAEFLAGAALVEHEELEPVQRNPRRQRPFVAAFGMGLGPPALVEVEPRGDAHALRLLRESMESHIRLAFRLEGEVALVVDFLRGEVGVAGPGRVLVFDTRGAREDRGHVREARLSVLADGDLWKLGHRRAHAAEGSERLALPLQGDAEQVEVAGLEDGLAAALTPLLQGTAPALVLRGPFGLLELRSDLRSERWRRGAAITLHDLVVTWRAPHRGSRD